MNKERIQRDEKFKYNLHCSQEEQKIENISTTKNEKKKKEKKKERQIIHQRILMCSLPDLNLVKTSKTRLIVNNRRNIYSILQ